jgi:hypothetical protein
MRFDGFHYFGDGHFRAVIKSVLGIAVAATEIAAGQPHESAGLPGE